MKNNNIHGQRIADLRKRLGWSRYKLAVWAGKTERTIVRYEKGEGVPRADFMDRITALEFEHESLERLR